MTSRLIHIVIHSAFRRAVILLLLGTASLAPAFGQYVPNRYAVILEDLPVAAQVGRREDLQKAEAVIIRQQIEAKQRAIRDQLESLKVSVNGSANTVMNAIFVSAAKDQVTALKNIPGVKDVVPVRRYNRSLNRALSLLDAPSAWGLVGGAANAGNGIKIGVLDDGIEQTNPMFQAPSLPVPAGFPICSGFTGDCSAFTNNKVIVARSYVQMLAAGSDPANPAADSRPDDYTPSGRDGHGTAVASVAGGVSATGTVTVNGMAPGVYLGSYKIYGSPGVNNLGTGDDVIIAALDDAIKDGMDIVSFSTGGPAFTGPLDSGAACGNRTGVACDLSAQAFENAAKAGLVIVAAAGNDDESANFYPNFNSIESPGDAPSVISVGATSNSHYFNETVQVAGSGVPTGLSVISAGYSDSYAPSGSVAAPLSDVATLGNDGLACTALPAGSLVGAFALIQRGTCNFAVKMANAVAAGAGGVVFYLADSSALFNPSGLSNFDQPVALISLSDGLSLKSFIASNPGRAVTINPSGQEVDDTANQNQLAGFSSVGPSTGDSLIKPDLVAVGESSVGPGVYMAASDIDPLGDLYSSDGFISAAGTSFSTPMVSGAAAIVKQHHPGFTAAQVKSALVNTATQDVLTDDSATGQPIPVDVEWLGAGKLDAGATAAATVTCNPATLSFGAIASASLPASKQLAITNSGSSAVNLAVTNAPGISVGATISLSTRSLLIGPGASANLTITLSGSVPAPGEYSGAITLLGSGSSLRIPYMYLVGDRVPANIFPLIGDQNDGTVGQVIPDGALAFKITDDFGLPVTGLPVSFRAGAGGTLSNVSTTTDNYGIAYAEATLGSQPGDYTFTGSGGGLRYTFTDSARLKPTIVSGGIVNAASFTGGAPVAPGSYISIFGSGLSDTTDSTTTANLPLAIDLVNVSFDVPSAHISVPGHLIYVSPDQVNLQVPWALQGQNSAQVKVTIDYSYGNVVTLPLSDYAPGLFEFSPGSVAAQDATYASIGTSNPARRGQTIVLYANGLGPVTNQPAAGAVAQTSPLSQTTSMPTVTIGGQQAAVAFSGLTPGFPALYQVNVVVPQNLNPGNNPIVLSIGGETANTSGIMIQ